MRYSSDTLCEITGATEQLEILIASSLDGQTCMHRRETMQWEMYCLVQGQGRTANTVHELLKEQTWKEKFWSLLDLTFTQHSVFQAGMDRGAFIIYISHTTEATNVVVQSHLRA